MDIIFGMYFHRLEQYTDIGDYNDVMLNERNRSLYLFRRYDLV